MPFMSVRVGPDEKSRVLGILRAHHGKAQAITSRELAKRLQLSTREVREIIAQLVSEGELIGASVAGVDGGFYLIENEADLEETRAILRSRASKIFERDRELCKAWIRRHGRALQPLLPGVEG
jgi:transcription initiation factor IIE alpha subunit